jgi:hypothetical protein
MEAEAHGRVWSRHTSRAVGQKLAICVDIIAAGRRPRGASTSHQKAQPGEAAQIKGDLPQKPF